MPRSFLLQSQSMSGGLNGIRLTLLDGGRAVEHRHLLVVADRALPAALDEIRERLLGEGLVDEKAEAVAASLAPPAPPAPQPAPAEPNSTAFVMGVLLGAFSGAVATGLVLLPWVWR